MHLGKICKPGPSFEISHLQETTKKIYMESLCDDMWTIPLFSVRARPGEARQDEWNRDFVELKGREIIFNAINELLEPKAS